MGRRGRAPTGRGRTSSSRSWRTPSRPWSARADLGEHARLRDTRLYLQYASVRDFCEPVERLTGRRVRSFHSSIDTLVDGMAIETFVLHPEGTPGPARADLPG